MAASMLSLARCPVRRYRTRAVIRRCSQKRQAKSGIDRLVKSEQFDRNQALIVIQRQVTVRS